MKTPTKILFTERQRFRQWWIWLFLLGINGLLWFAIFRQVTGEQPFGDNPMSNTGLFIVAGLLIAFTILFLSFRLDTVIQEDGIYFRFFPFHWKLKHYPWDQLAKVYVRQYSLLAEYGGWGLRMGLFGKGSALNVSGNQGLQLEFTDGKKLLIGTNQPGELTDTLKKMGQLKF